MRHSCPPHTFREQPPLPWREGQMLPRHTWFCIRCGWTEYTNNPVPPTSTLEVAPEVTPEVAPAVPKQEDK